MLGRELGQAPPRRVAGGHDQAHGVVLHGVVDEHVVDRRACRADQLVGGEHLVGVRGPDAHAAGDLGLLLVGGLRRRRSAS